MKLTDIRAHLHNIGKLEVNYQKLTFELTVAKKKAVKRNLQERAKEIWVLEQIITLHDTFEKAFYLLQSKSYYSAWQILERLEIELVFLKRHFQITPKSYRLPFIEKAVQNLQILFPYRIFGSSEYIKKKVECSVCGQQVSIRKPCGHLKGEIYNGEMCTRIVTEADLIGVSMVENPKNKYSVMFLSNESGEQQADHYNYENIDYLMSLVQEPYEYWNLELQERYYPHDDFETLSAEAACPCGSGDNYNKCCFNNNEGIKGIHYEFKIGYKTAKRLHKASLDNDATRDSSPSET